MSDLPLSLLLLRKTAVGKAGEVECHLYEFEYFLGLRCRFSISCSRTAQVWRMVCVCRYKVKDVE